MSALDDLFPEPVEVDTVLMVFPATVRHLMPPYEHTNPEDPLRQWGRTEEAKPYLDFMNTWFALGLGPETTLDLKEGIDGAKVVRHLKTVIGSFEPKHEHKELAVAWLLWRWSEGPPKVVPARKIERR